MRGPRLGRLMSPGLHANALACASRLEPIEDRAALRRAIAAKCMRAAAAVDRHDRNPLPAPNE